MDPDPNLTYVYRRFDQTPCSNGSAIGFVTGDDTYKCTVEVGFDQSGGRGAGPGIINISNQQCCDLCAQNAQCTEWVYGPLNGVNTCFPAADVQGRVPRADRSFCCMGSVSVWRESPTPTCATVVPRGAPVPLSTSSPGERNCTVGGGDDPDEELVSIFPVVHGFALLGETTKWVHASPNRFSNITITVDALSVTVTGAVGEDVFVTVLVNNVIRILKVTLGITKSTRITVSA